jgi:hypothetical protein
MTINCWRVRGPSRHCHGYRPRENGLGKRFSRYRDGHDAHRFIGSVSSPRFVLSHIMW